MLKIADGFCDHMLLQRQHPILVWGTGEPGESVTVQLANQVGKTLVDATGSWTLSLPPMEAGRQLTLTLFGADTTIQIDDVAIGDLYLAAGQSNMEFALGSEDHYEQARKAADGKDFRWMGVPQVEYEGDGRDEPLAWRVLNAQNVQDVSAVALYALLEIATHTDVPLGVIGCYKGGTSASCWIRKQTLMEDPELRQAFYEPYWDGLETQSEAEEDACRAAYQNELETYQRAVADYQRAYPERSLSQLKHELGHTPWPGPKGKKDFGRPGGLRDTMLRRVLNRPFKAVWWYQGEEDAKSAWQYEYLLGTLIDEWRHTLGANVPFFLVQLPGYKEETYVETWPILRQAQAMQALAKPNVDLICTLDQGDSYNIHPTNKQVVGTRLGQLVSRVFYDPALRALYPKLRLWRHGEENVELVFENIDQGSIRLCVDDQTIEAPIREGIARVAGKAHTISYAWQNDPECLTWNALGLPMFPFQIEIE